MEAVVVVLVAMVALMITPVLQAAMEATISIVPSTYIIHQWFLLGSIYVQYTFSFCVNNIIDTKIENGTMTE